MEFSKENKTEHKTNFHHITESPLFFSSVIGNSAYLQFCRPEQKVIQRTEERKVIEETYDEFTKVVTGEEKTTFFEEKNKFKEGFITGIKNIFSVNVFKIINNNSEYNFFENEVLNFSIPNIKENYEGEKNLLQLLIEYGDILYNSFTKCLKTFLDQDNEMNKNIKKSIIDQFSKIDKLKLIEWGLGYVIYNKVGSEERKNEYFNPSAQAEEPKTMSSQIISKYGMSPQNENSPNQEGYYFYRPKNNVIANTRIMINTKTEYDTCRLTEHLIR